MNAKEKAELQRIYSEIESGMGGPIPVAALKRATDILKHARHPDYGKGIEDEFGRSVASPERRWKFRKVYKGPGYPVDPANESARAIDAYVNAFSPQPHGVFDRSALDNWLVQNIN